jgi:DNA-binding PadR family transcriptional regulator
MTERRRRAEAFLPLSPLSAGILLAVAGGARHGYAIIKEIERQSEGRQSPGAGSLYAALRRLTEDGVLAESEEGEDTDADSRRKYYGLTDLGREVARLEVLRMAELVSLAAERRVVPGLRISFSSPRNRS